MSPGILCAGANRKARGSWRNTYKQNSPNHESAFSELASLAHVEMGNRDCMANGWIGSFPAAQNRQESPFERPECDRHRTVTVLIYTSVCSDISSASSISMPRYLTVLSSFECPSRSCTAQRFLVRL